MHSAIALSVAAFAALSAGQASTQNNYPYRITPDSVSQSDRDAWCSNQVAQCPLICLQQPGVSSMTTVENTCNAKDLTYSCVCENNITPNVTQYSQTLPFYICQEWGNQCVKACNGDNTCGSKCRSDHPCGAQSPYKGNTSLPTIASRTSAATTSKIPVTGFGGVTASGFPAGGGAASASFVPTAAVGLAAVLSSAFLGFAVFL